MTNRLATGLSALTSALLSTEPADDFPRNVAEIISEMLPRRPLTGLVLLEGDTTVGGSRDAHAMLLDEAPRDDGLGAARQAMRSRQPVSATDLGTEQRWGAYPKRMVRHGIRSAEVCPLMSNDEILGTLGLYSPRPNAFDDESRRTLALVAEHVGLLLGWAFTAAQQEQLTEQLRAALQSRSAIDQALGILIGQHRCSRDEAFDRLRRLSNQRNIKLARVAADLVAEISGTGSPALHFDDPAAPRRIAPGWLPMASPEN
ncbi:GAF and ANTAR domain-containing protein [Nocardia mexicana]|uniref:GAF domain-containing protein n=1 Tax=Nocardia mexicana TaxID=279262 RepID=A0A370HFL7_9NOCA|nr:GAF and ANTAR domain-containing protein [Nocardia mexicana]RDI55530.1 GAF domain-containing protein [Nocardia mexicana]